jgi:hypothetical protein
MYVIISALTRKLSSHRPNQPESVGHRRNPNSVEPFSLLLLLVVSLFYSL